MRSKPCKSPLLLVMLSLFGCCAMSVSASAQAQAQSRARADPRPSQLPDPDEAPDPRGSLGLEIAGAFVGTASAATLSLAGGYGVARRLSCRENPDDNVHCALGGLIFGSAIAAAGNLFMIPAGVSIAGRHSGGPANYGMSVAGSFAGLLTGGLGGALIGLGVGRANRRAGIATGIGVTLASMWIGSVLTYRRTAPLSARRYALTPTFTPRPKTRGFTAGIAGSL